MELLIVPLAALYLVTMVIVHAYARSEDRGYSLIALAFMTVLAAITTSVHFVVLTVGPHLAATGEPWVPLLVSFTWPSVVYALDILAWDWFFALSVLAAAAVFRTGRLERAVRLLLLVSGVLSLLGLLGVPLADMQVRNVGVVGYAVVAPVAFLVIGLVFGRTRPLRENSGRSRDSRSAARHVLREDYGGTILIRDPRYDDEAWVGLQADRPVHERLRERIRNGAHRTVRRAS
jgi:hypothetical protein